ncbi:hypothetical protein [Candidatus Albibeggiatoa sp. nov. NOAA]|uniref:hypothetical protein n=1 Tax=Candidatus Albibeggiatoa sp. nov. NOAA TaxID=3162724 RepID=UPI003340B680
MIQVTEQQVQKQFTQNLLTLLQANQGRCPIIVNYQNKEAEVKLRLGGQWAVMPSDDFISQLENLLGHGKVKIEY